MKMSNDHRENIPSREIRHFAYAWDIRNPFALHTFLTRQEFYITSFNVHPKDQDIWCVGLKRTTTSNGTAGIGILLHREGKPEKKFLNVSVSVISKNGMKLNFRRTFKVCLRELWQSPPFVEIAKHMKYIEKETLGDKSVEVWRIIVRILYYDDVPSNPRRQNMLLYESCLRKVGADLTKYVANEKFSDLSLHLISGESIHLHKAIVRVRCPEFLKRCLISRKKRELEKYSYDVLYYLFLFLYSGNFESLIDSGIIPVELYTLARELKLMRLAYLTRPDVMQVSSNFETRIIAFNQKLGKTMLLQEKSITITLKDDYQAPNTILRISMIKDYDIVFSKWYVGFVIQMIGGNFPQYLILQVELISADEQDTYMSKKLCYVQPNAWAGIKRFCPISTLKKNISKFETSNHFRFRFTLSISKHSHDSQEVYYNSRYKNVKQKMLDRQASVDSIRIASGHFLQLMSNRSFSDINVKLGQDTLKLNRVILASRSKWFSELIDAPNLPDIQVTDIDVNIFSEVLREIYAGRARIYNTNHMQLYIMANRFHIPTLKYRCIQSLKGNVTSENCIKMLELLVVYPDEYLKTCLLDWCKTREDAIRRTDDWKRINRKNLYVAQLLIETFSTVT